jgi:hypothetical protein
MGTDTKTLVMVSGKETQREKEKKGMGRGQLGYLFGFETKHK